ncbi:SusC/RagA family TonB-linked outer membrane protein [Parasediminibacterium paludis]|uniref:SusC/RagA family TonB-linked outer membrane protein n=1 Tax=Parasediminibacterium paludis TaxID=908966 RepID=A0ABV8Q281_9BACT
MRKLCTLLMCFLVAVTQLLAQTKTITGKIVDEKGTPVVNASVLVKGTTKGTTTSQDGSFTLSVPSTAKALVISSVNFTTQEVTIKSTSVNVTLQSSTSSLDEVVVVGYGTQKKSNLTASVVNVGGKVVENTPMSSVDQMLQGKVAGLQSVASTGQVGANQLVRIRGVGSFGLGSSQPLYIVDGVQINSGDLSNGNGGGFNINPSTNVLAALNSDDIENISVLKDAAATSIYGSRGSNGVIIITTKSGKVGKTQFRFDTEIGNNTVIKMPEAGRPLAAADWFTLLREGLVNSGASQASIDATMANYGYGSNIDTHWLDLVTQTGTQEQYNLSANGGDAKTKFYLSGGLFKQQGTTIATDLQRITGTLKITHNASDKLSFTTNAKVGDVVQNSALASSGISGGGGYFGNPGYVSLVLRPTQNPYNADGSFNISTNNNYGFPAHYNPLYVAANDKRYLKRLSLIGGETVEYKIIKDLKFTSNIGLQYTSDEEYQYNNPFMGDGSGSSGAATSINTRNFLWDWYNQFDYHLDLIKSKKFVVDLKAGYEAIKNSRSQLIGSVNSFPPKVDLYSSENAATSTQGNQYLSDYAFASIYSGANFSLLDKYSLSASYRRDGSSRFGSNNIYGNFYSVGASWNVINEDFMKNVKFITGLKLKGSYGTQGNAEIGNYQWRPTYSYGANYNGVAGGTFNNIGNVNLTWEKLKQSNIGIEVSFLKSRITVNADLYKRTTEGALIGQKISPTTGFSSFINNAAGMENKGFEISVNLIPVQVKDFTWQINFNISHNTNTVTSLPAGDQANPQSSSYLLRQGQDFYAFYTRAWAGVNPDNGAAQWYTDSTKSTITTNRANAKLFLVGKSASPKYFGGLGNTFTFKNFSLSFDFYYNYGNYIQEGYAQYFLDGTYPTRGKYAENLKRWQNKGDITDVPKYVYGNTTNSSSGSDRLLYKGDYIRLRNLQLAYKLDNKAILSKLHVSAVNFYVRGTNLWTKTYDDRLLSDPEQGVLGQSNQSVLPSKSATVGLNITF